MKVLIAHADGTKTIQYEVGDRVVFVREQDCMFGFGKIGDHGTVTRAASSDERHPSIAFVEVQTDEQRDGGWGALTVAPWYLKLEGSG